MILIIDNYDSFVYNLARYVSELNYAAQVIRNNAITVSEIAALNPSHIIISPGPCTPDQAGISLDVIQHFSHSIPILGVCLGHQAIAQSFGGKVVRAGKPYHGKSSLIHHTQHELFTNISNPFSAGRYHSLIVSQEYLPDTLEVIAYGPENEIMALRHRQYAVFGVQFHPESILTEYGHQLLQNFLMMTK